MHLPRLRRQEPVVPLPRAANAAPNFSNCKSSIACLGVARSAKTGKFLDTAFLK